MPEKICRTAIIGLGYIGGADQVSGDALGQFVKDLDGTHYEVLSKSPRVELVAGSSRDGGRRERFAARAQARTYAGWREMLTHEKPEIVSVATYAPQHAEITIACAEEESKENNPCTPSILSQSLVLTPLPNQTRRWCNCWRRPKNITPR